MTLLAPRVFAARSPLTWVLVAASLILFGLGLRAVLAPEAASAFFGAPVEAGEGLAFVRAFGARNMGLAMLGLLLVRNDDWRLAVILLFASSFIALVDGAAIVLHHGAPLLNKHALYCVAFIGLAILVARRGLASYRRNT